MSSTECTIMVVVRVTLDVEESCQTYVTKCENIGQGVNKVVEEFTKNNLGKIISTLDISFPTINYI